MSNEFDPSDWLPALMGPVRLSVDGVPLAKRRRGWDFIGAEFVDDPENESFRIRFATGVPVVVTASGDYVLEELGSVVNRRVHVNVAALEEEGSRSVKLSATPVPATGTVVSISDLGGASDHPIAVDGDGLLIDGAESYSIDHDLGFVSFVFTGAAGWRTVAESSSEEVPAPADPLWSYARRAEIFSSNHAGDYTTGLEFMIQTDLVCRGVRFFAYWTGGGTKDVKCCLYNQTDATLLATATVSGASSGDIYEAEFDPPIDLSGLGAKLFAASCYVTDGSRYLRIDTDPVSPALPLVVSPEYVITGTVYSAGDARPTTGSNDLYAIEPLFAFP